MMPCVQVALDTIDEKAALRVCELMPRDPRIMIEAGTPLVKQCGIGIVRKIKAVSGDAMVLADLKAMDTGALEALIAKKGGADAATVMALAGVPTMDSFIAEAARLGILSMVDMMGIPEPAKLLKALRRLPDGIILHRGIDAESAGAAHDFKKIVDIKNEFPLLLIGVAGGMDDNAAREARSSKADILIVGRFVTGARNPEDAANKVLSVCDPLPGQ
jgi:bifunctional enzyme Fae/Hps